jgi:hypothetical protein
MSFTEIQHINGKSDCFRTGLLRFEKEYEKEIYETLSISNWENIITNEFIEDAIINPTIDKLQRLLEITNKSVFDRVRTILVRLQNSGSVDISHRVINTLKARQIELQNRIYKSEILLKPVETSTPKDNEVDKLKTQVADLQAMVTQLLAKNKVESESVKIDEEDNEKKSAGRPANKKK